MGKTSSITVSLALPAQPIKSFCAFVAILADSSNRAKMHFSVDAGCNIYCGKNDSFRRSSAVFSVDIVIFIGALHRISTITRMQNQFSTTTHFHRRAQLVSIQCIMNRMWHKRSLTVKLHFSRNFAVTLRTDYVTMAEIFCGSISVFFSILRISFFIGKTDQRTFCFR